jgi:hypothetical protein
MDGLQSDLNSRRAAESRQLAERSALLLQLETLNGQLVETAKKASDWEIDANKQAQVTALAPTLPLTTRQDNYGLKQTIATLQQRSVTLVSRAAAAADSNKILQARSALLLLSLCLPLTSLTQDPRTGAGERLCPPHAGQRAQEELRPGPSRDGLSASPTLLCASLTHRVQISRAQDARQGSPSSLHSRGFNEDYAAK